MNYILGYVLAAWIVAMVAWIDSQTAAPDRRHLFFDGFLYGAAFVVLPIFVLFLMMVYNAP